MGDDRERESVQLSQFSHSGFTLSLFLFLLVSFMNSSVPQTWTGEEEGNCIAYDPEERKQNAILKDSEEICASIEG